jgi:hypothetical protein
LGSLAQTYTGSPLAATAVTNPTGQTVAFTYTGTSGTTYATSSTAPTAAGSYTVVGTINGPDYSGTATGTLLIAKATPTITWAAPASVLSGTALSSTQLDATASVPGAFVYTPAIGITPAVGNDTLSVAFTPTDTTDYTTATASVILTVDNPAPVMSSISPGFATDGGAAFPLTITGTGFGATSTAYWGATALSTQYVSPTQLTAQVTAAEIASGGIVAITVQSPAPGGGTSNAMQFEVNTAGSTTTAPTFGTAAVTVSAGATATYPVTLPATATDVTVACLNLPSGATCSYSSTTNAVTIATSSTTPKGTYQVTVVFTEDLSGASSAGILLPILLLPLLFLRRKLAARGMWISACLGLVLLSVTAFSIGCGGSSPTSKPVTSSGVVSLTIQ